MGEPKNLYQDTYSSGQASDQSI